jgi:Fe-S cluster assembly protein SufD
MNLVFSDRLKNRRISLGKNQKMTYVFFAERERKAGCKLTFELNGAGAELKLIGLLIGKAKQQFNFDIDVIHKAKGTKSNLIVKNALFDESSVNFKGNIVIEKSAHLADAYLAHHTLLLSERAFAKSIPALEIMADDVKAGHAATMGKIDNDLIFYLMSRGISRESAIKIFIRGFFENLPDEISDKNIHDLLRKYIIKLLP